MENDQPDKRHENLDDALGEFDEQNKLNLTGGDKQDDVFDPKIQQEYQKFMKQMNAENLESDNMQSFTNLMSNLLSNISKNMVDDQHDEPAKQDEQLKKKMQDMFKNLEGGNFQDFANKLLDKFMDKDMLKEPMEETKLAYEATFKNPDVKPADMDRYQKQYEIVLEIIDMLEKQPDNKNGLIEKFEKMQGYGNPPPGIDLK